MMRSTRELRMTSVVTVYYFLMTACSTCKYLCLLLSLLQQEWHLDCKNLVSQIPNAFEKWPNMQLR